MKVIIFAVLLGLASARYPRVVRQTGVALKDLPALAEDTDAFYNQALQSVSEFAKAPFSTIQEYGKTGMEFVTKYGNQVVDYGRAAGPYIGAIAILAGMVYAIATVSSLVFNTKMDLARMGMDYVRNYMNTSGDQTVQDISARIMPMLENFKEKFE